MKNPIKFTLLEPQFLKWADDHHSLCADSLSEADGVIFVCPECLEKAGGVRPGVHSIICWEPNVPSSTRPGPGRWTMLGTGFHDITLQAGSSSIHIQETGCGAHFYVRNGEVTQA